MDRFDWSPSTRVVQIVVASLGAPTLAWLLYILLTPDLEKAIPYTVHAPEQLKPRWKGKTLAEPSIKISGSTTIQCYAPATGELLGVVNPVTPDGIDRAIAKAAKAQQTWARTTFGQRRRVLKTLLTFILDYQDDIVRAACLDSGKTRVDALFGEVLVTAEKLKWTILHGEKALQASRRPTNLLMFYKKNEVRYEPLGVVGACVSWNYPFHNLIGPIISALFSGNAIIIKNSEQTAWSSAYFANVVCSALKICGHDPDLVHAVSCWPATAAYFAAHPGISHLTFIGSRPVAHEVAKQAAKALTPLCVELGGKDPAIVLDDPAGKATSEGEMRRVASIIMRGVYQSGGQNCIGIERVIATSLAYERLIAMLEPRVKAMRLGYDLADDGGSVDMGAMISPASFTRLEALIAEAVAQGAECLTGGHRHEHPDYPHGHYFEPTLLVNVTSTMRIAQEEAFAPICMIMRAESVQDSITIANSTSYGLGASVFGPTTSSTAHENLRYVAERLRAGMVAINDFAVFYAVQLPFGGVKGSGYGRFAGEEGLRSLCNAKSVCQDRWPGLIKTSIPPKLDYPMRKGAWEMGRGVVEVGYGEDWRRRAGGLRSILGM
ncbi:Meiotic Sister-Chromatid recombination aldehyde dehydrogenase [Recurvomyces mirabilis]|uniref:aldehyde dehydrogenase (NAD(+)) n=1 Tax=Recurvomyces mirabilis TaxID=574656 RepID=A0AAE0WK18_9PEZI|nr:Meiotic Sister-Chromatid recombination aldehyde dehydrogenase [Recurvomyces mirabilis]KAK5153377.1 Meiotic Sister-Chromatid recombination aldehyde dehydrogenase [Recurvomyces mirabilis]